MIEERSKGLSTSNRSGSSGGGQHYVHASAAASSFVLPKEVYNSCRRISDRSAAAAVDRVIDILGSTDRDPETPRVCGELDEFGDWPLQYNADIGAGRILVGAGNTVVDFAGMTSTAALGKHATASAPRRASECTA